MLEEHKLTPFQDQNPGTSGLRKKTKVFMQPHYLASFVESILQAIPAEHLTNGTILVSGDGRYFNNEAIKEICEIIAAHPVKRIWICENGLCSTPAASCIIRRRENGVAFGGILLTASHNPGGPDYDFGIKYNLHDGSPAPEHFTSQIYQNTLRLTSYKKLPLPALDLSKKGTIYENPQLQIEVISSTEDYIQQMESLFYFPKLQKLLQNPNFSYTVDCMHGVASQYATPLFVNALQSKCVNLLHNKSLPDFGGLHPDPNLVHAHDLVSLMLPSSSSCSPCSQVIGFACDGDADRCMIIGKDCFVSPSDSLAIIAAYTQKQGVIAFFDEFLASNKHGQVGVARSIATSSAVDRVCKKNNMEVYEVPTGWKYFCNLMNAGKIFLCGEESFGASSSHIREKDSLWTVLCWLSILAYESEKGKSLEGLVKKIMKDFWEEYGRCYYTRFDYEEVTTEQGKKVMEVLGGIIEEEKKRRAEGKEGMVLGGKVGEGRRVLSCDNIVYTDVIDGSVAKNQGMRFVLEGDVRVVYRLSGTGSSGATIRVYMERYVSDKGRLEVPTQEMLKDVISLATKELIDIQQLTGRDAPSVIT